MDKYDTCPDCSNSPCDCGLPTTPDAVATEPRMGGSERRLVRELRWMLLHLVFLVLGFALVVWGGWSMIFDGNHTTLAQFQGGYVMYAMVKIDGWLKRKSGLPNDQGLATASRTPASTGDVIAVANAALFEGVEPPNNLP